MAGQSLVVCITPGVLGDLVSPKDRLVTVEGNTDEFMVFEPKGKEPKIGRRIDSILPSSLLA